MGIVIHQMGAHPTLSKRTVEKKKEIIRAKKTRYSKKLRRKQLEMIIFDLRYFLEYELP